MTVTMQAPAEVNTERCHRVGEALKSLRLKEDFYRRPYLNVDAPEEIRFRMHFFAVAICHQTHTLHHPGLDLWGWDYIEKVFTDLAGTDAQLLHPDHLLHCGTEALAGELAAVFSHTGKPEDTTLDRLHERAGLMRDAASHLINGYDGKVGRIFETAHSRLCGSYGLYWLLPEFEAFADPQQKKSTFLIKLLEEDGLVQISDPENFIPIMDYHMQRVLLRLGCVEVTDEDLRKKLVSRETLQTDEPIRGLCIDAFKIIADTSGFPVTRMNDFFWSLGRSCCHETTLCSDGFCSKNPCTFTQIVDAGSHKICVFQDFCPGASDPAYRERWHPVVDTHFY